MNRNGVSKRLSWEIIGHGDYEDGQIIGRKVAEQFLSYMGSGSVPVYNQLLPAMMRAWVIHYRDHNKVEERLFLDGQKDGFLARLSEFLVVAAYTNNCGLSPENNFNPALIKKPDGLH